MSDSVLYKRHPGYGFLFCGDNGTIFSFKKNKANILEGSINRDGYIRISVARNKKKFAHVLIMEAHIGFKPLLMNTNHKNGEKQDNRLENLEYVTEQYNVQHSYDVLNRYRASGENAGTSKLTNKQAEHIRELKKQGLSAREINKKYNQVGILTIQRILRGATYKA